MNTPPNRPLLVTELLATNPRLHRLLPILELDRRRLQEVRRQVGTLAASHCLGCHLQGDTLTVYVDSPVWADRLRFQAPTLASALRPEAPNLRRIRTAVMLDPTTPPLPRPARRSARAARTLREAAAAQGDTRIAAALQRLGEALAGSTRRRPETD